MNFEKQSEKADSLYVNNSSFVYPNITWMHAQAGLLTLFRL